MKADDATVHGFRSSFRDWAGNVSNFPREITETALAHVMGDKAEQAYRRSDALEKRRKLMEAWASYAPPVVHGFSSIEMSGWFMSASERADPELYELFKHRLVQCHHACADGGLPAASRSKFSGKLNTSSRNRR